MTVFTSATIVLAVLGAGVFQRTFFPKIVLRVGEDGTQSLGTLAGASKSEARTDTGGLPQDLDKASRRQLSLSPLPEGLDHYPQGSTDQYPQLDGVVLCPGPRC